MKIVPSKPLVLETFQECPGLGRIRFSHTKQTVAVGVVRAVEKKPMGPKKSK